MEFEVVGVRSHVVSPDGSKSTIGFVMKSGSEVQMTIPSDQIEGILSALRRGQRAAENKRKAQLGEATFRLPKKWTIGLHPFQELILLVFDAETENQAEFALPPDAAKVMSTAFADKANELVARRTKATVR